MALEFDMALNTRKYAQGIQDAVRETEGFADVLDDFGREAEGAGDKGERAIDDLGDAAQDAERRFRDLTDEVEDTKRELGKAEDAAKDFGRKAEDAGRDAERGMERAGEGVEDFKSEAKQNAEEVASSFDGSIESIADGFQGLAATALSGFGPAGIVAGVAVASGIGLGMAAFEAFNEATEESKERASEWASAFIEAGGRILTTQQYIAAAQEIMTDPEQYDALIENTMNWGVAQEVALAAMTGDMDALAEVQASLTQQQEDYNEAVLNGTIEIDANGQANQAWADGINEGNQALDALTGEMEQGGEQADIFSAYLRSVAEDTAGATTQVDEFGDSVTTLPDGTTIYIDAETGQATTNVDAIEARIYGIPDGSSTVNVTANTSQAEAQIAALLRKPRVITAGVIVRPGERGIV